MATLNWQDFDEKWIVIDRDEFEYTGNGIGGHSQKNFNSAIEEAEKNKINIACSNPWSNYGLFFILNICSLQ